MGWSAMINKKIKEIKIDQNTLSINQKVVPGKVMVIILDGGQGKAGVVEAVHHGTTIIETTKGKAFRVSFKDDELF